MLTLAAELRDAFKVSFVGENTPGCQALFDGMRDLGIATLALDPHDFTSSHQLLCDWLVKRKIDIFNNHAGINWEGLRGLKAAEEMEIPVIVRTEHLPYILKEEWQREEHRNMLKGIDRLICVSEEACRSFQQAGIPENKLTYVQNGIRPARVTPQREELRSQVRALFNLPAQSPLALSVGRYVEQKGYHALLDSASLVCASNPTIHFLWVGSGPQEHELRDRIEQAGLQDRVHMLGQRTDVPELMAASDLFVMATRFEGLPLVVLEAMAAALPVVSTRTYGLRETVIDGLTGRLFDLNDHAGMAEAIITIAQQPELARRMGRAGQARQRLNFNSSRMAQETTEVFYKLLRHSTLDLPALALVDRIMLPKPAIQAERTAGR